MQTGQTSSSSSSSGTSSSAYTDNQIVNMRRRFEILTVEAPELDFATRENLAKSGMPDDTMVESARSSVTFAARQKSVQELASRSNKEQNIAWEKMSESRKQFLVDAGYTVPQKKKAQWVSWWEYPQHYTAEYVAKGWNGVGLDSVWRATGGKPAGWFVENVAKPGLETYGNLADDIAGRTVRAAYDALGQNQLARWQIQMQATRAQMEKDGTRLSEEQWQQVLWKYTDENLDELHFLGTSNTNVNMLAQAARFHPMTGFPIIYLEGLSAIPGLGFLENIPFIEETQLQTRKVNPYTPSETGVGVDDATYQKFADTANTLGEMEQYSDKSVIDVWNRVDNGYATPDKQLKVLKENFDNDFEAFDIALWESQGKSVIDYLQKKEKLEIGTPAFQERYADLETNILSKNDYNEGLNRLKADEAKISLGRIVGRGLGIQEVPYLGDIVSGTVDGLNVVIMDPANLLGPAFKWTRFARFGISAKEIGLAAAADDAIGVVADEGRLFFNAVDDAAEAETLVVKIFDEPTQVQRFKNSQKVLQDSETFKSYLTENGVDLERDWFFVDNEGMPTPFLLDNWEAVNAAVQSSSDSLIRDVMTVTGSTPEDIVNIVQRRAMSGVDNTAVLTQEGRRAVQGVYSELNALDHLRMVLARTTAPVTDINTGGRVFNWMANSSLKGTRRWMDRVVQGFIDKEAGIENALSKLADDLPQGRKIIATLADYHELLKSRGLQGITSRKDLWSWLESSALYHMNIGDITGQISRGFGNGIRLPNRWRVFGRLGDDVGMLVNRESLGMLPRLARGNAIRRKIVNSTENLLYFLNKNREGEALAKRVGLFGPRAAAKFAFALSHHVPANTWINLASDDAVVQFRQLLDYGFFAGMPKEIIDEFFEKFISGTSQGTRVVSSMTRQEILRDLDSMTRSLAMLEEGPYVLENDLYNLDKWLLDNKINKHPVIMEIGEKLGISSDEVFVYRRPENFANEVNGATLEAVFEFGWSDEVISRWDEVEPVLEKSTRGMRKIGRQEYIDNVIGEFYDWSVDDVTRAFYEESDENFASFVRAGFVQALDMGLTIEEAKKLIIDYVNDVLRTPESKRLFLEEINNSEETLRFYFGPQAENAVESVMDKFFLETQAKQILEQFHAADIDYALDDIFRSYRRETIFNSSTATRMLVEKQFLHELFNRAGVYASEEGRKFADDFLHHLDNFRYAPNGEDEFALKTLSGEISKIRVGVLPYSQRSRAIAIPAFDKFVEVMDKIGLTGRFTRRLNRSFLDSAMTQIWKPLTLMRLGFIPRAAGEEYLAFYARRGIWAPMASIASNIGPNRRGFFFGSLNHLGSLPSRFFRRVNQAGWTNELSTVAEVLKFKNQAEYMAARAERNIFSHIPIAREVDLAANMAGGTVNPLVHAAKLTGEQADRVMARLATSSDYLRIAAEYHTAKVAASVKRFNFKLMPKHLQRAILANMGGSDLGQFARDLGLVDHYAVTAALQNDADKLLRTAYMQQNFADAQSGVGGMIADPIVKDPTSIETVRVSRSPMSKEDDIVVQVAADRDWVSVDPTKLEDDGLYLAAGQQGSLIDNDPIAMEAVRSLAGSVDVQRLARNYEHLTGTQWVGPLPTLADEPLTLEGLVDVLADMRSRMGIVPNELGMEQFIRELRENPIAKIREYINTTYDNSVYFGMEPFQNFEQGLQIIEARAIISTYIDDLTPTQFDNLRRQIMFDRIEVDFGRYEKYVIEQDGLDPEPFEVLKTHLLHDDLNGAKAYIDSINPANTPVIEISDETFHALQVLYYKATAVEPILRGHTSQNLLDIFGPEQKAFQFHNPENPYFKPQSFNRDWRADKDVIDDQIERFGPTIQTEGLERTQAGVGRYLENPELADSFAPTTELQDIEKSIFLSQPEPVRNRFFEENRDWFVDPFASPDELQIPNWYGQTVDPTAQGLPDPVEAKSFLENNLFRVMDTQTQYYIDAEGNLHMLGNKSGRNKGQVISTTGAKETSTIEADFNFARYEADFRDIPTFISEFHKYWGGENPQKIVVALDKEELAPRILGAGADNPDFPFEIEVAVDATGEVVVPKGKFKIFYDEAAVATQNLTPLDPLGYGFQIDRASVVAELEAIVRGDLDQANSIFFKQTTPEMQWVIEMSKTRGSLRPIRTPEIVQKINYDQMLQQFEDLRGAISGLDEGDYRLVTAAMQADELAAGKSAIDDVLKSSDLSGLHPMIQHTLDYMPEGSYYAKAIKKALENSVKGDNTLLEVMQVLSLVDRDVAQAVMGRTPLRFADEAADTVLAQDAVMRALQDPAHAAVVQDHLLAMVDEASGAGVARPLNDFNRPIYSVMVDPYTAKYIEHIMSVMTPIAHQAEDARGLDTLINLVRANGASDEDIELLQRLVYGFDPKFVAGAVQASNPLYRSTLVPISTTAFTNYQDAKRLAELLTDLKPPAGEYRRYLGWTSRPRTRTYAHVGSTVVPSEKNKILNAVISDDGRSLVFEPNFQYNIDKVSPLAEKENLITYNNLGEVTPAGEFAVTGIPQEQILNQAAQRIVSSVMGFVQSRNGRYLHELIGPMVRGEWGVDAMYHVPIADLPTRVIYRKPFVAPVEKGWQHFVNNTFGLINKAIYSISRAPQFMLGLADGLAFAREITDVWRDKLLDDTFESLLRTGLKDVPEGLEDVFAAQTKRELQNSWAMIGDAANSELSTGQELLDELHGLVSTGKLDADSNLLDLTAEQMDTALEWVRMDAHLEKLEMQRGLERAVAETIPYIDDHNVRSFFQVYAKNIFPFEFAQEAFLKRWARTVVYSPEAFRRMQLLAHSLQSAGFTHEDPVSGKMVFVFPWTESLEDLLTRNPATQVLFGDAARIPIANPLTGKLENVLPGIPSDFQNLPQVSPIAMVPLTALAAKFPEFKPVLSQVTGGRPINTSGVIPTVDTILSQWVPANYLRLVAAGMGLVAEKGFGIDTTEMPGFGFTTSELHQGVMSAIAQLESESIRLRAELETVEDPEEAQKILDKINLMSIPSDATDVQIEQHVDMIMQWARMNMMFRAVVGFAAPTSPRNEFKDRALSAEFGELLKNMPAEEALAAFLTEHPNAQPWTIFQTEKSTAAELAPTERALNWMNKNREFYDQYNLAAPWFMPQSSETDEYSQQMFADMTASGQRTMKLPEEFYKDMKFAAAANIYFPSKTRKDMALENASSSAQRKEIENGWTVWSDEFKKQHPIFANILSESIDSKSVQTLNQLHDLLLLDNDQLPDSENIEELRTVVQSWKRYESSMNRIKGLSSKDIRAQRDALRNGFLLWGEAYTFENPNVRSLWLSLVLPATDLTSEARLMEGKN